MDFRFRLVISMCLGTRILGLRCSIAARSASGATGNRGLSWCSTSSEEFRYFLLLGRSIGIAKFLEVLMAQFGIVTRRIRRWTGRKTVFGKEIAVGDVGVLRGFAGFFGAVDVAYFFKGFLGFAFDAFGMVFVAEFFGGLVAVFLEDVNLAGEPAEDADGASEFIGFGGELLAGFGFEEELGEFGGNELEADFGELAGVVGAELRQEVVLEEAGFEGTVLCDAPVAIAATSFPVGDVTLGDFEIEFVEGLDDLGMGNVVAEHAVDHVTSFAGEAGDFAVAGAGSGWIIGWVGWWIDGWG
jgi:hypothetical protein